MELLDEVQIRAINIANGKKLPETPTLMFEFIGTGKVQVSGLSLFDCGKDLIPDSDMDLYSSPLPMVLNVNYFVSFYLCSSAKWSCLAIILGEVLAIISMW